MTSEQPLLILVLWAVTLTGLYFALEGYPWAEPTTTDCPKPVMLAPPGMDEIGMLITANREGR